MMYEQPVVLRWGSPGEFLKLFFPKSTESRISEDWRVQKLRNCTGPLAIPLAMKSAGNSAYAFQDGRRAGFSKRALVWESKNT